MMRWCVKPLTLAVLSLGLGAFSAGWGATPTKAQSAQKIEQQPQKKLVKQFFSFSQYHTNYLLPYWLNGHLGALPTGTPDQQPIKAQEVKFQISFKTYVLKQLFNWPLDLLLAYTQKSYWQLYQSSAFFRETNYQPEIFFHYAVQAKPYLPGLDSADLGFMHQSNGRGGDDERSWNRFYARLNFDWQGFSLTLMPWLIMGDNSVQRYNPDISHFLGHGKLLLGWRFHNLKASLMLRNNLESAFSRGAIALSMSYPLSDSIDVFVQAFSGYGQNLIEYNHYTTGVGLGLSLSQPLEV